MSFNEHSVNEFKYYSLVLIDITFIRNEYTKNFQLYKDRYLLSNEHFEDLFDWCVQEAFFVICLRPIKSIVLHHYRHDVYKAIYDEIGQDMEVFFRTSYAVNRITYQPYKAIKVMVAGPNLIIAQQGSNQ